MARTVVSPVASDHKLFVPEAEVMAQARAVLESVRIPTGVQRLTFGSSCPL